MGRGFVEYHLPTTGRREFVAYSAFLTYRLAGGASLPVDQEPAWCRGCSRFTLAERLPPVADLEKALSLVRAGDGERLRLLAIVGRTADDEADELLLRIEWRRGRVSSPRCLECGAVGTVPLPADNEFAHPGTGELVAVASSGFASMERWIAEFTPEGIAAAAEPGGVS